MSAEIYLEKAAGLIEKIHTTQYEKFERSL